MRLNNKVAIVTGGSRGIGLATVERFLQEGAAVILTASSQANADKAAAALKEKYPQATIDGLAPDLTSLESVREAFGKVVEKYGRIDILVNNAGISERTPFTQYTEEVYDKSEGNREDYGNAHLLKKIERGLLKRARKREGREKDERKGYGYIIEVSLPLDLL